MEWLIKQISDPGTIAIIATTLLLLVGLIGGGKWIAKLLKGATLLTGNLESISKAIKESVDPLKAFTEALKDNKFTKEEVELIIKEINEAKGEWKNVFAKKEKQANT